MIVARAEELRREKDAVNYVECKFVFSTRDGDKCFSFRVYPCEARFRFCFGHMTWVYPRHDNEIDTWLKTILRQIFRNFMRDMHTDVIDQQLLNITVSYKNIVVFTGEYYVEDAITHNDLASYNMTDCNDNADLFNIQEIVMGFLTLTLNAEFASL